MRLDGKYRRNMVRLAYFAVVNVCSAHTRTPTRMYYSRIIKIVFTNFRIVYDSLTFYF